MTRNKCVAVILAGGQSSRMGQPKGLLDYFSTYWLLEQLQRLKSADISVVYIGLGYSVAAYFKALPILEKALSGKISYNGIEVRVILNSKLQLGAFSTLKKVLEKIPANTDILVLPIDIPILNAMALKQLKNVHGAIVKPIFKGKSGHPIKLSDSVIKKLLLLPDDSRLDTFINTYSNDKIIKVICTDWQICVNINTPKQWAGYKHKVRLKKYLT